MFLSDLIVPLHGDPWLLRPPLWTSWQVDPTVLLGTLGLAAFYIFSTGSWNDKRKDAAQRPVTARQRVSFVAGCLVLLLALGPPLEDWAGLLVSDGYGVYQKWVNARQTCLAHLIRTARGLAARPHPELAAFGAWALVELQRLCQMAKAPPTGGEWRAWYARV
jgi:hypothetical protein